MLGPLYLVSTLKLRFVTCDSFFKDFEITYRLSGLSEHFCGYRLGTVVLNTKSSNPHSRLLSVKTTSEVTTTMRTSVRVWRSLLYTDMIPLHKFSIILYLTSYVVKGYLLFT